MTDKTTPSGRLRHFAEVWNQIKPTPEVYGLETGHPKRESALTTTDLLAILDQHDAMLKTLRTLRASAREYARDNERMSPRTVLDLITPTLARVEGQ